MPKYAFPVSFMSEEDKPRLEVYLKAVKNYRETITEKDINEIKKSITAEMLSDEDQKLNDFRKKIFKIQTSDEDLSFIFLFCKEKLLVPSTIVNNKKFVAYLNTFDDLERLDDLLKILSLKPFNKSKYDGMLSRLISPYKSEMHKLIEITQKITKSFYQNQEDEDDDIEKKLSQKAEEIETTSTSN